MEKITAYKCSFCKDSRRSIFSSQSGCSKHEKRCWLNPARKSCATCENLILIEDDFMAPSTWACSRRSDVTPFKKRIHFCPVWEKAPGIFSDEEPTLRRPVERRGRGR